MLAKAFKEMADRGATKRLLHQGIDLKTLTKVNTPGAWLLDTVYTILMILVKKIKQNPSYTVVLNDYHVELLHRCNIDKIPSPFGEGPWKDKNSNNRGNVTEYLAWLALEQDRCDILVAMVHHYDLMEPYMTSRGTESHIHEEIVGARGNPNAISEQAEDAHQVDLEHHTQPYSDEAS